MINFILGLIIGGLIGIGIMCLFQINRDNELQNRINKAIDKLYCWGEVLDPKFQKGMLEILGDKNEKDM